MSKVMAIVAETLIVQVFTCTRCNYRWVPEFEFNHFKKSKNDGSVKPPVACAHCHSPYYNKMRKSDGNGAR